MEHYKEVFAALEKTSPVPVGFEKIEGGAHGYYHLEDKRIAVSYTHLDVYKRQDYACIKGYGLMNWN